MREPSMHDEGDHDASRRTSTLIQVFKSPTAAPKTVKRPRPVKSCTECRKRKLKCDRLLPCSQCQKSKRDCRYSAGEEENGDGSDVSDAEPVLERLPKRSRNLSQADPHQDTLSPVISNGNDNAASVSAASLEVMASRLERIESLLMGREQSSSEPTTKTHPRFPVKPAAVRGLSVKGAFKTRFFSQNSTKGLLNLFDEAKSFMIKMAQMDDVRELFIQLQKIYKIFQGELKKSLDPISVYADSMMPIQKRMADILPKKNVCDRLLGVYIAVSEGLYRIIHVPTFQHEYDTWWSGHGCSESFIPRLMCMLAIGSRCEFDMKGYSGVDRSDTIHAPTACVLVRHWLDSLRGKQLVDFNTLQAEVLLIHAQRTVTPRPQDSWTQLGYIVRMAMTMGLHRDPAEYPQLSFFTGEIRRRLWYTIMDMDLHMALACNLPAAVREGDYTCKPPRNLNDHDIYPDMKELPDARPTEEDTDAQIHAFATRTVHLRLRVSHLVTRLDQIKDFDEIIDLGAKMEAILDDINAMFPRHHSLDTKEKFRAWRNRALLDIHIRRPLLMLYRPFALSAPNCPPHIMTAYLKSSVKMLTYMEELDPHAPGFNEVNHMYQMMLKHDIVQASFSVCYFIKIHPDNNPYQGSSSRSVNNAALATGMSPSSTDDGFSAPGSGLVGPESWTTWSAAGLVRIVERMLAALIAQIKDSSSDLKDIVALSIVLNSVQAATPEQKHEKIKAGVRRILDTALQVLNAKPERGASNPMANVPPTPIDTRMTPDIYMNTGGLNLNMPDDFPLWDFDFWNSSQLPMEQP